METKAGINIDFYEGESACTKIIVVGVGGGGCNSVNRMIEAGVTGVEFIAVNTDRQALGKSKAAKKIAIGTKLTGGRGAGALPEVGEKAALEDEAILRESLKSANMVFITGGMGGGTGTGAAPVIAKIAKELGCLTVAVVTKPFGFEQKVKGKIAAEGIAKLEKVVDTLILISNQALIENSDDNITMLDAYRLADDVLKQGVQGISNLIVKPGEINIDFADVQTVMKNRGKALIGIGVGQGENAAVEAAQMAIANPLTDLVVSEAKAVLVSVTGSRALSLREYNSVMEYVKKICNDDTLVIEGQTYDDGFENKIEVTIVATGFAELKKDEEPGATIQRMEEIIRKEELPNQENEQVNDFTAMFDLDQDEKKEERLVSSDEFRRYLNSQLKMPRDLANDDDNEVPAFRRIDPLKKMLRRNG